MKAKHNLILTLIGLCAPMAAQAADIDVIGNSAYSEDSFASTNAGIDGGLGTNVRVIAGDYTAGVPNVVNVTWTSDNTYFVTDKLYIPRGATLTIQPGTKVYFSTTNVGNDADPTNDLVGSIVACRGGKLIADGTAANPIVFTSVREWEALPGNGDSPFDSDLVDGPAPTSADAGLWGGIVLLGQAYISTVNGSGVNAGTQRIEGFEPDGSPSADSDSVPDAIQYGVSNNFPRKDDDNSGVVRYCSIRHGGYEFSTGKEINGLTLGGVGSGTTVEYVEIYANKDDGVEFFGGRVSTNNIVVAFVQDDIFDIDEGYRGTNQFWFGIQNPGDADGGGEWDGVGGTSGGYPTISSGGTLHHSKPVIYNATIIGAGANNTLSQITNRTAQVHWEKGNHAFNVEDFFNGEVYNSVFHDFAAGVVRYIDSPASSIGNNFVIENNTFGSFGGGTPGDNLSYVKGNPAIQPYDPIFDLAGDPINGNSDVNTNPMFTTYTRTSGDPVTTNASTNNYIVAINPIPAVGSPLLSSPVSGGAPKEVSYRGAFGPEGNWAAGWTKLSQSGVLQGAAPAAEIVDTDGDGIDDTLEGTAALADLGFTVGVNNVTNHGGVPATNLFNALYDNDSIQDVRGTGLMIGPVTPGGNAVLTLPIFKSDTLLPGSWTAAGNATATVPTPAGKKFFRVDLSTGVPNP